MYACYANFLTIKPLSLLNKCLGLAKPKQVREGRARKVESKSKAMCRLILKS